MFASIQTTSPGTDRAPTGHNRKYRGRARAWVGTDRTRKALTIKHTGRAWARAPTWFGHRPPPTTPTELRTQIGPSLPSHITHAQLRLATPRHASPRTTRTRNRNRFPSWGHKELTPQPPMAMGLLPRNLMLVTSNHMVGSTGLTTQLR